MEIKKGGTVNTKEIQQLVYTIWPDAYGAILSKEQLDYMLELIYNGEALKDQIENLEHQFIIVYEADIAVAFASYSPKEKNNLSVFRLHKLYVLPSQQGKGTGKLLLNYIINEIKKAGASILELNVNRHNKAFHFYKKTGFTISHEADIDIGNGYFMNDYVMELEV
ncbi:MAG: GNAT family N-acetyltransferase [Ferruginibacter sp.]